MQEIKLILRFLAICTVVSCASYTSESEEIRQAISSQEYKEALEKIDKSSLATQSRNKALFLMEKGTIHYLNKDYRTAAGEWREASEHIDKLYTVSLSNTAASFAMNDSYSDYEGELHEKVLLPIFSALAYLAADDLSSARVEVRRTDELMKALENAGNDKPKYARDSFASYLSALLYESKQEWDSAIIEYRKGLENLQSSESRNDQKIPLMHFAGPLCRLAKLRNRPEILKETKDIIGIKEECDDADKRLKQPEIIVFYEAGRSPIKVPVDIVLPIQGQVVRISYPSYKTLSYSSRGATVSVDGKKAGRTETIQDIGFLAKKSLEARRVKDIVKMGARVLAKDQAARAAGRALGPLAGLAASIVGAVTETADTRSWTSLPDKIEVLRIPVNASTPLRIDIVPDGGKPERLSVNMKPGEKKFVRLRTFY